VLDVLKSVTLMLFYCS